MFNEKCYDCFNFSAGDPFECIDCLDNSNFIDICSVFGKKEKKKMTYGEKLSSMELIDILIMMEENREKASRNSCDYQSCCIRDFIDYDDEPSDCPGRTVEDCRKCLLDLLGSEIK